MVAYAYAGQYPSEVERIVLLDAFLPGVGDWKTVWLLRDLWHFRFYGENPLKLVAGRERIYFEHFWNDFAICQARLVASFNLRRTRNLRWLSITRTFDAKVMLTYPRVVEGRE
jgi:pimeloyl-ACP methyl ester carboxylesterase